MTGFCITRPKAAGGNHLDRAGTSNNVSITSSSTCGTGTKCGRWNPTAQQVKVLKDLFTSGLRTPSTDQIQNISSQLSIYGKIENKNVFYWFQNHKARERQKRRRVSVDIDHLNHNHYLNTNNNNHHDYRCGLHEMIHRDHEKFSSLIYFGETNQNSNYRRERVMETLELFPLNSFNINYEGEPENIRFQATNNNDQRNESTPAFSYAFKEANSPPLPLDLRLSFL